ncbi:MAG TPA: LysR substrate-binding domain-containing protein [Alphaproteobacteria bacterium]
MTLLQLKMLREIARQSLNISAAAKALHTSQPGVSRQIQMLEKDLGVQLLVRQRNRIVSLSKTGHAILAAAQVLLNQADNIELLAEDARGGSAGKLVVVTTHLHARYTILRPFKTLQKKYPDVQLFLFQADPDDIPKLVKDGAADIGLNTSDDRSEQHAGVVCLSGNIIRRSAIMRRGHPLARKKRLTLNDFTAYPFVGYNPRSRSGSVIARAFAGSSVAPRSIVQANDSDVIKAYVAEGLGIGVVPEMILGRRLDEGLHAIDVTHLFPRSHTNINLRSDMHLRKYVSDFIQMVAPSWTRGAIQRAVGKT